MLKAANLTVRVKQKTRDRLENLARATHRSKSYVIEEALEQYLDVNEWQISGIQDALNEADSPGASFATMTRCWQSGRPRLRVKWLRLALLDLDAAEAYIADDLQAAAEVVLKIVRSVSLLQEQQGIGRAGRVPGTRELVGPNTEYSLHRSIPGQG